MNRFAPLPTVLPLIGGAFAMLAMGRPRIQRAISFAVLTGALALSVALLVHADRTGPAVARIGAWSPAIGISYVIDRFGALMLVIAAIKARRFNRRRTSATGDLAAAGAWDELVDQFSELGYEIPQNTTRKGVAVGLREQVGEAGAPLPTIAARTDEAVFSGVEVAPEITSAVWTEAMAAVEAARGALTGIQRILSRYRVSSARAWIGSLVAKAAAEAERLPRPKKQA